ncbi:MAG TPA: T9SS type A sorting domain-containing protein [Chitinophagales bacterium]|nr:T9SS type A sorting domain-containing protein [Chitinophagales bacterium]
MSTQLRIERTVLIIFVLLCGSLLDSFAQNLPTKEWDKSFGSERHDEMFAIIQTNDGGYLLAGDSDSPAGGDKSQDSQGLTDFWVVKTNASGNKLWDRRFGGNNREELFGVLQTADNGYLLGGGTLSVISGDQTQTSRGDRDYWIVKIDANGVKLWDKRFGGPGDDELRSMAKTSDGGFILGGESSSDTGGEKTEDNHGVYDVWIVKVNANGNLQWEASYGGTDDDRLNAIQQTADGGYIIGAWTISPVSFDVTQAGKGSTDMWLVKTDASGVKMWDSRFGGSDNEYLYALDQTSDGGFILGGYTRSEANGDVTIPGKGGYDFWMVKTDGNGIKLWDKRYGGDSDEKGKSIYQTNDGGFMMGGWSESGISGDKTVNTQGGTDYWLLKSDANGNKQWDLDFGANVEERLHDVPQTSDGGFIIGGLSESGMNGDKSQPGKGLSDFWMVKLTAAAATTIFYADADGDGFGNAAIDTMAVTAPPGYVSDQTDCNDANGAINPAAMDICNSIDDNCNQQTDENAIIATITPAGTVEVCKGTGVTFIANTGNGISYQWMRNGASISNATSSSYSTTQKGTYSVTENNLFSCSSASAGTALKTLSNPDAVITPLGNLDICTAGSVTLQANEGNNLSYQWKKDGNKIIGATNQNYVATAAGKYQVGVVKNNGCKKTSATVIVTKSCKLQSGNPKITDQALRTYPNPTSGKFTLLVKTDAPADGMAKIEVMNLMGQQVQMTLAPFANGVLQKDLSFSPNTPEGLYLLKVSTGERTYTTRVTFHK